MICPAPEATARSARKSSSVSPDRAEMTAGQPAAPVFGQANTVDSSDSDFMLDDQQDPISELEALAASDDTAALDLDDSDLGSKG